MNSSIFIITAQTNLHPGSGDANYGIIDKLVQRDSITDLPIISASSLKGALLQHFWKQDDKIVTDQYIDKVFGGQNSKSKRREGERDGSKSGEFIFMQANLLSLPVRTGGNRMYFSVTSSGILSDLSAQMGNYGISEKIIEALNTAATESKNKVIALDKNCVGTSLQLEDQKGVTSTLTNLTGDALTELTKLLGTDNILIVPDATLKALSDNHHLPVIARNHLENGQSSNLWYEQVLPRQTRFSFAVLRPKEVDKASDFDTRLMNEGLVQIGANASVGYGYCKISKFL